MMKKNGFTLVEMSIVLIVIGVILALALKGLDAYRDAALRLELRKVLTISDAIATYSRVNRKLPGDNVSLGIISLAENVNMMGDLVDGGLIAENDFTVNARKASVQGGNGSWKVVRCVSTGGGAAAKTLLPIPLAATVLTPNVRGNLCIFWSATAANANPNAVDTNKPQRIVAGYELFFDDANIAQGSAVCPMAGWTGATNNRTAFAQFLVSEATDNAANCLIELEIPFN